MPDATITSTASTFGTITGTFAADQSTVTGTVTSLITGTLSGSVGVPGPQGPTGPQGPQGPQGVPGAPGEGVPAGGTAGQVLAKVDGVDYNTEWIDQSGAVVWGDITGTLSAQTDLQNALDAKQSVSGMTAYLTKAGNLAGLTNLATARDNLQLGTSNDVYFSSVIANTGTVTSILGGPSNGLEIFDGITAGMRVDKDGITFPDLTVQTTAYPGPAGATTWGSIVGTLSNQTDLQTALDGKASSARGLPPSGTVGQVLTKQSGTSYDANWATLIPGDRYVTTSTSTLSVSNGTKSLTIGTGLAYTPNQDVTISLTSDPTLHHMHGPVTSYNSGTGALVVDVQNHTGSGTFSSWTVNVGGTVPLETVEWGEVLGTLGDQTDLATALNAKLEITDAASTYQTISGMSSYLTTADAATTYYLQSNPAGYITSSALSGYATESWVTSQGYLTSASLSGYATESWVTAGFYPLTGNPSGFITSAALSPYLLSSTAASTYQTISGMSSYLTTSAAATNYVAKSGSSMTGGLTFSAGGYIGSFSMLAGNSITIPDGGAEIYESVLQNSGLLVRDASNVVLARFQADQVLVPSAGITFSDATTQTTAGISSASVAATYQTIAGMSSYAPKASPALTGNVTITSNSSGAALFIEQAGTGNILTLHDQASDTSFVAIDQNGKVNTIASTTTNAGFNVPHGTAPTTPVNGDIWTTTAGLSYYINGATVSPATLAGGTFTGPIITAASTTSAAGLRVPVGTAPTTPTAGDIWSSSGANGTLNFRSGGGTNQAVAALGLTQTFTGNNTFSGGTLNFGNATTATTIGLGNGATATATTKTLNIGTGGVAGSTTTINVGTTGGGSATANVNALLISRASTATEAGLRILPGTAPSAPVNGDTWTDAAGFYARINGATQNLVPPALATLSEARQFTNDTKVMSPRDVLWSMLSQDFIDIDGPSMTVTNTGTITSVQVGQLSRSIRPGNAGACSSRIRTFGVSQVDQTWTATSRAQPASFLNFSLRSIHSGRSTTSGVTDANYTCAVYYGKAEADGVGDLTRRGYGWKMVGGAGSRFLQLQAHNGTTLSSVTSSFAVTAGVAFDWDIESDGAGNVTLYVNGSSVATSNGGPTGSVNITAVAWQEEVVAAAALSSPFMDFTNSRGRFIVINTW